MTDFDKLQALKKFREEKRAEQEKVPEIKWKPVSNIPIDEIYKNLPKAKKFHEEYVKMWGLKKTLDK